MLCVCMEGFCLLYDSEALLHGDVAGPLLVLVRTGKALVEITIKYRASAPRVLGKP